MIRKIGSQERDLQPLSVAGAEVRVHDAIVACKKNLAAGFTEYTASSRLPWVFDYDEVFFILDGVLEIHADDKEPVVFSTGDLGYVGKGTKTVIVVPERAYLLHMTQPAWR